MRAAEPDWIGEQPPRPSCFSDGSIDSEIETDAPTTPVAMCVVAEQPQTRRKAPGGSRRAPPPRASPIRGMNLTAALVRSEVQLLRSDCQHADLLMERAQRVHDELDHELSQSGLDEEELDSPSACAFHSRLELALAELEGLLLLDEEAVPDALGFADPTILAEVKATRENVRDAISQCRVAIARCEQIIERAGEVGGMDADEALLQQFATLVARTGAGGDGHGGGVD